MSDTPSPQVRKTALITGASAGLGREFARLFAADGHDVMLVARRADRLQEVAAELREGHEIATHVYPADLSNPGAPQGIFDHARSAGLTVEFLVNNAGFGSTGAFAELDADRELGMIAVNITSLVHLTRLFLPPMLERGSGRVLNLGSTAGFQAGPFMATYYASKAFVNLFSEALWHELRGTGVSVTVSCPGATGTEFAQVAGNDKSKLFKSGVARSDDVARAAYRAMHKGRRMIVHGLKNKTMMQSLRFSPRGVVHRIAGRMNKG